MKRGNILKENQRVRLSKKMLKDSLIFLLSEKNIHKISVIEICEKAQINRTTFYKYYGSQYDLLKDMENDVLTEIDNYLSDQKGFADNNLQMLTDIITFINSNFDFCKILLNNNVDAEFPEKLIKLPSLRLLVTRQLTVKYSENELDYAFDFVVNGGFSIIRRWINKENREAPSEISNLLINVIMKVFPASQSYEINVN